MSNGLCFSELKKTSSRDYETTSHTEIGRNLLEGFELTRVIKCEIWASIPLRLDLKGPERPHLDCIIYAPVTTSLLTSR